MVHPACSLGMVIKYAKVEATKESTKATTASIMGGIVVEEEGRKKGI